MRLPPSRDDIVTSHKILNDHGLAVPNWPVEWGGLARRVGRKGLDPTQHQIWLDEMQLASVPELLNFNTKMVGPVNADFGSQETKKRFLPPTANPNSAETHAWHLLAAAGPPLACSACTTRMGTRRATRGRAACPAHPPTYLLSSDVKCGLPVAPTMFMSTAS